MTPKENYADIIRSLRICANEDPKSEGCEDCLYETGSCYNGKKLKFRAACVIDDLCELCQELQNEKKGVAGKDESMHKMQPETEMHDVQQEPVQAKERLGQTYKEEPEAVTGIEKLIDDLRAQAEWIRGMPVLEEIPLNMLKAARLLEIELQRREYHDLGNGMKDRDILRALEHVK